MLRSGGYAVLFGMNFGWLTAHIGSAAAFVLLGIVLPLALVIATLIGARWLTRNDVAGPHLLRWRGVFIMRGIARGKDRLR